MEAVLEVQAPVNRWLCARHREKMDDAREAAVTEALEGFVGNAEHNSWNSQQPTVIPSQQHTYCNILGLAVHKLDRHPRLSYKFAASCLGYAVQPKHVVHRRLQAYGSPRWRLLVRSSLAVVP